MGDGINLTVAELRNIRRQLSRLDEMSRGAARRNAMQNSVRSISCILRRAERRAERQYNTKDIRKL